MGDNKTRVISQLVCPKRKSELTHYPPVFYSPFQPQADGSTSGRRAAAAAGTGTSRAEREGRGARIPAPAKGSALGPSRGSGKGSSPATAAEAIFCPPEKAQQRTWRPDGGRGIVGRAGGCGGEGAGGLGIAKWSFLTLVTRLFSRLCTALDVVSGSLESAYLMFKFVTVQRSYTIILFLPTALHLRPSPGKQTF